jgi:hypothetical protein
MDKAKENAIREKLGAFLDRRYNALKKITLDSLDLNPFLLKLMSETSGIKSAEDVVRWALQQRVERGTVTSFGMLIQGIAKLFSGGTGVEGADISKESEGRMHYVQVKSGPNTVNKDIAQEITRLLRSASRRDPGSVPLLGMCYGKESRVNSIIRKYVDVDTKIGAKFWEFISGDKETHKEIYNLMSDVASSHRIEGGKTYQRLFEDKVKSLTEEFKGKYGFSGDAMWRRLLEGNM